MLAEIKVTQPATNLVVSPVVRWAADSRLSESDKAAMQAYTRDLELAVRRLTAAVRELQTQLDGRAV